MILSGNDPREVALSAAFDEESEVYPVGSLQVRPFSLNAFRRAESMSLMCVLFGFDVAGAHLKPADMLGELERLAWLLCAPLQEVRSAFRLNRVESVTEPYSIAPADVALFKEEMDRVLHLLRLTQFKTEDKPPKPNEDEEPPPAAMIAPGTFSSLIFGLATKLGMDTTFLMEWMPACQAFQYIHNLQFGHPNLWTVSMDPPDPKDDPWGEEGAGEDEGFGEEIDF